MGESLHLKFLERREINVQRWNACAENASNGAIYFRSEVLDIMSSNWSGIIYKDYEAIMPISWRTKYGITYWYQPHFVAHTGIAGQAVSSDLVEAFLNAVPSKFRYWDIDLNEHNCTPENLKSTRLRINMFINLQQTYPEILQQYHRLATRMLRKATDASVKVEERGEISAVLKFYRGVYAEQGLLQQDFARVEKLFRWADDRDQAVCYIARIEQEIVAVYALLFDEKYVYSVLGGSNQLGKMDGAFYLLTDMAIRNFASTGKIFRFEGSDIEGIAKFNGQFGATPVNYQHLNINRLPWPIRFLKR